MKRLILSPQMEFEVALHGLLLWASMGFLLPLGILLIRVSNTVVDKKQSSSSEEESLRNKPTMIGVFFYFHVLLQILAVLLSIAGAVMSIKSFDNSFSNNHQRIGLALYFAVWIQTVLGFSRPRRGSEKRGAWYLLHWLLGTAISIAGVINIYLGLKAYEKRTSKDVRVWMVLFTAQISVMAVFYIFQDKWHYLQKQRGALPSYCGGDEPIIPSHSSSSNQYGHQHQGNVLPRADAKSTGTSTNTCRIDQPPYPKANALKNLFK